MNEEAKPRILIVDDEPDICELLEEEMTERGFETASSTSVDGALALVPSFMPQVIISDVRMPHKSGLDLIRELNEQSTPVPIILVSGYTDTSAQTIFELGAAGLFSKPIDTDALERLIRKVISIGSIPFGMRNYSREKTEIPARFGRRSEDSPSDLSEALLCNLSRGGGYFRCDKRQLPSIGDVVSFHFHDKRLSLDPVHGSGTVRWNHASEDGKGFHAGFGLEFTEIHTVCFPAFFDYITAIGSLAAPRFGRDI